MSFPHFLRREVIKFEIPLQPLVGNCLKPPPGSQNFAVIRQDPNHTYWCWAAVMITVLNHLGLVLADARDQCALAKHCIKGCIDCNSANCDNTQLMGDVLAGFRATSNSVKTPGLPDFTTLAKAIDNNRPIVCDGQRGSSLHAEIISGYYTDASVNFVAVADPSGQSYDVRYDDYICSSSFIV